MNIPRSGWSSRVPLSRLAALAMIWAVPGVAEAGDGALNPCVRIDQGELVRGEVPLYEVLEAGRHLFTTPFTVEDGFGEGPTGPRRRRGGLYPEPRQGFGFLRLNGLDSQSCFECHNSIGSDRLGDTITLGALSKRPGAVAGAAGFASNAFINPDFPETTIKFIRNPPHTFGSAYVQRLAEEISLDLLEAKAQAIYDARTNPNQPRPIPLQSARIVNDGEDDGPIDYGTYTVTYRPGAGGAGGPVNDRILRLQSAAIAIVDPETEDIESQRPLLAASLRRLRALVPSLTVEEAEGLADYVVAHFDEYEQDVSGVEGISRDLVVRPFQWKGIASNMRNFVRDALNFHFAMQPVESFFRVDTGEDGNPVVVVDDHDQDEDGVRDELRVGDVSALSIFTMTIRPPSQDEPEDAEQVDRGRALFNGEAADVGFGPEVSCASCHSPTLRIEIPVVEVRNPLDPANVDRLIGDKVGLSAQRASSADLPIIQDFQRDAFGGGAEADEVEGAEPAPEARLNQENDAQERRPFAEAIRAARNARQQRALQRAEALQEEMSQPPAEEDAPDQTPRALAPPAGAIDESSTAGFFFNLTTFGTAEGEDGDIGQLTFLLPRLEAESPNGPIEVPLFSDLKRHHMGSILRDIDDQGTDTAGIAVPSDQFLTRPLWGLADSAPWMHDGRATTLRDAILLHRGSAVRVDGVDFPSSEANASVEAFQRLSEADQEAILAFLRTLRLPSIPDAEVAEDGSDCPECE